MLLAIKKAYLEKGNPKHKHLKKKNLFLFSMKTIKFKAMLIFME